MYGTVWRREVDFLVNILPFFRSFPLSFSLDKRVCVFSLEAYK